MRQWIYGGILVILIGIIAVGAYNLVIPNAEERAAQAQAELEKEQAEHEQAMVFARTFVGKLCPEDYDRSLVVEGVPLVAVCSLFETMLEMEANGQEIPAGLGADLIEALGG